METMTVRHTIRTLRLARLMTQRELAERIGVNHMSIYHWESGRNEPSARQLRALAGVFRVPMEAIAFEREAAKAEERPATERSMSQAYRDKLIAEMRKERRREETDGGK